MKRACSGRCLNARTSRGRRSLPWVQSIQGPFHPPAGANLTGDCKLKPVLVYYAENPRALKGYDKTSLPVHWFANSSGWMTGHIFQAYSKTQLVHELKEYCTSQGLPFKILMVLDNAPAHLQVLSDLHSNIKFVFLLPNTMSLLQPIDQGMIKMFKAHFLQKSWRSISMKCDVSLDELEKAAQTPKKTNVELEKDVVRRHWKSYTIRDAFWNVRDAWKEVLHSGACGRSSVQTSPLTSGASTCPRGLRRSASSWQGRLASTRSRKMTWALCWSRSARSC